MERMDEALLKACSIIITKCNKPVDKLVPVKSTDIQKCGRMKGMAQITGDLIEPIEEKWDANLL